MDLSLDAGLAASYHSNSQKARVLTESWVGHELYCPHCNCTRIEHFPNNTPVADFFCPQCGSQYELKSKSGNIGDRVVDGAYESMIQRISSNENPDFFFMGYSLRDMRVLDLIMVPKFFFVPAIIERRNPLSANARRAGWVGCNIRLDQIPIQGRIPIVTDGTVMNPKVVTEKVRMSQALEMRDMSSRGWLMDVLSCVNRLPAQEFTLEQVYRFEDELSLKHPGNRHIRDKIRQQLQLLRDRGFIEFLGRGKYRKKM